MSQLADPWMPRGLLSEAHITANTAMAVTAGPSAIAGTVQTDNGTAAAGTLQVTIGVLTGRRYRIRIVGQVFSDTAGDDGGLSITNTGAAGSLYANTCRIALPNTGAHPGTVEGVFYPSATASATFTVNLQRFSGTGHIDAQAGLKITAEDVGLAP